MGWPVGLQQSITFILPVQTFSVAILDRFHLRYRRQRPVVASAHMSEFCSTICKTNPLLSSNYSCTRVWTIQILKFQHSLKHKDPLNLGNPIWVSFICKPWKGLWSCGCCNLWKVYTYSWILKAGSELHTSCHGMIGVFQVSKANFWNEPSFVYALPVRTGTFIKQFFF